MIDLPIFQNDTKYSAIGSVGAPCVEILAGLNRSLETVIALIDTGADFVYAAPEFLDRVGAPILGVTDVNGAGAHNYHAVSIQIPGHDRGYVFRVIARDMLERDYSLVLGRSFLQYCKLVYNGPKLRHGLTFYPLSIPRDRMPL
ncbi:pepsin/retropepsin-like aspartic protease family protein [Brucella intermedia]|uniref:hypothetical protein n=1 Tax=Brucella intermedia TaxID=94625 RepID=UPI00224A8F54|nr:hypothetical protein [Brucella intermedia]